MLEEILLCLHNDKKDSVVACNNCNLEQLYFPIYPYIFLISRMLHHYLILHFQLSAEMVNSLHLNSLFFSALKRPLIYTHIHTPMGGSTK